MTFGQMLQFSASVTVCLAAMYLALYVCAILWWKIVRSLNERYGWELYDPNRLIVIHKQREESDG